MEYVTVTEFLEHFENKITRQALSLKMCAGLIRAKKFSFGYMIPKTEIAKWEITPRGNRFSLDRKKAKARRAL